MRGFLSSSIGVTCAAALALPLALTPSGSAAVTRPAADSLPGSTQSLPLEPLGPGRDRAGGGGAAPPEQGLTRRDVRPFSLVGVVWDDPDVELQGRVQVRTRATGTTTWSPWQEVETHNHEHAADPGTAERDSGRVRGSTAPLWVGDSDGVEVRVRTDTGRALPSYGAHALPVDKSVDLPTGLRLELVDPGEHPAPPADATPDGVLQSAESDAAAQGTPAGAVEAARTSLMTAEAAAASAVNAELAPMGAAVIPELDKAATEAYLADAYGTDAARAKPYIGPRPRIVTRRGWGADESLRERNFAYTRTVKAAFLHHSATGNNYRCSQSPSVLRSIYRYHVKSSGWRDFGYNFAVDKCGNIYEGRAGGVAKAVLGAHTLGFNTNSMGIAVIGSFTTAIPPKAAVTAVAKLTAWKLGLFGANPRGKTYLKSGGGNLYKKGSTVKLNVISGHRDGFRTECPGRRLYKKLGTARSASARYQGR
ncbi:peptidoglycan recognition protein family protein [Streptomyces aureocirculatus]|uniref:peptidoglycan recognition protein family protein n=1 Tax=Streptomyces aureocirculatus TaxID=67275 RepID=UPI000B0146B4|nr:peptidoglycan recognition protein [Streptomyces aureocirculatus]